MEDTEKVKQRFLKDVANHVLEVKHDDGLYRHIRLKKPGSFAYHFDIVTWPGRLCVCGDTGTYVFERIPDMFEFFRSDNPGDKLEINTYYWTQKVTCVDRNSPLKEFSMAKFEKNVRVYAEEYGWPQAIVDIAIEEVIEDACGDKDDAYSRVQEFWTYDPETKKTYKFDDFWEYNCDELSPKFMWCCFAVAWGIKKYDEWKAGQHGSAVGDHGLDQGAVQADIRGEVEPVAVSQEGPS